jgi:hypothetical protein
MNEKEMIRFLDGAVQSVVTSPKVAVTRHEFAALAKCVRSIIEMLRERETAKPEDGDGDDD